MQRIPRAIDQINQRLALLKIYFGSVHHYCHPMENKIAFRPNSRRIGLILDAAQFLM